MNPLNASFRRNDPSLVAIENQCWENWVKFPSRPEDFELGKKRLLNRRNGSSKEWRLRYQDFPQKPKKIGKLRLGIITHWDQKSMNNKPIIRESRLLKSEIIKRWLSTHMQFFSI